MASEEPEATPASSSSPPKTVSSPPRVALPPSPPKSTSSSLVMKRPRRGERNETAFAAPTEVSLSAIDSPFQLQEYIAALIRYDPHDVDRICTLPGKHGKGKGVEVNGAGEEGEVDAQVWLYEHLRRVCQDLSTPWLTALQEHCSRATCPEMKAGEWLYLCAAHSTANEHECCAIDYSVHTLDGATALLNASRYFPSRLSIQPTSFKHFTSIARRLYRIFAHTWFHHRDTFESCEAESSLYARFLRLSRDYQLISADLLIVPDESAAALDDESPRRNP